MTTTNPTIRRLVNCYVVAEYATTFGTTFFQSGGGAYGVPEQAITEAARQAEYAATVWAGRDGYPQRIAGVRIVDVETGEQWMVAA